MFPPAEVVYGSFEKEFDFCVRAICCDIFRANRRNGIRDRYRSFGRHVGNATVTAINTGTGVTTNHHTNEAGIFVFPALSVGTLPV